MQIEKRLLWPECEDVFLEAYVLKDSPEYSKGKKRPAVLICPGGSYLGTSDREAEPVALRFAASGYHAFVLRYSTFFRGNMTKIPANPGPSDISLANPNTAYPGPLIDLAKAMLTIRQNAGRWLLDPDKVAICGFSAGGHLAASLGTHWQDEFLQSRLNIENWQIRPAALILGYPLTDFLFMKKAAATVIESDPEAKEQWDLFNLAVFKTVDPTEEILAESSPARHASHLTPPTFIWHTANDGLVPVANTLNFAQALMTQGVPCELHIFEDGIHGLSLADETSAANPAQINEPVQIWFQLAIKWLKRHLPV